MSENNHVGTIRLDGKAGATIQVVPNADGSSRVEVYNLHGTLLAYQRVENSVSEEDAVNIGFSLFNGFVFGYRACEYLVRQNVESILEGNSPLA